MDRDREFVLGNVWHDIGKFKQRARLPEDRGRNHVVIGVDWLRQFYGDGLITAIVATHHGSSEETWKSNLALIGYEADNCSASERQSYDPNIDGERGWDATISLANIFGRVRDPKGREERGNLPLQSYVPLHLASDWVEPSHEEVETTPEAYKALWDSFELEFTDLYRLGLHGSVDIVLHLLEKYLSCIPATTLRIAGGEDSDSFSKHPDISLFDHVKTSAAIAHCLYNYYSHNYSGEWDQEILCEEITGGTTWKPDADKPFLLVGGDLSGVQRFIYTVSSKGAVKSLKGRSFFLELFTEHLVDSILTALGLTRCQVIFTGGGHFYLIYPNTSRALTALEHVRRQTDEYLWQTFNGQIQQFIEAVPFNKADLRDVRKPWRQLSATLEKAKLRRWLSHLDEAFTEPCSPHDDCLTSQCEVCAREDLPLEVVDELNVCPHCRNQWELGSRLQSVLRQCETSRHMPVLAVWADAPGDDEWALPVELGPYKRYYRPVASLATLKGNPLAAYHLNCWDLAQFTLPESKPLLASTYHESSFFDVEKLVEDGFGMNLAAVLRLDVDNLGRIFSQSFGVGNDTLARKASLSRQLSLFFKYHLDGILRGKDKGYKGLPRTDLAGRGQQSRRLGVIYSGGDDLFLLGHWLDVLEAAIDIREAFSRFTANPGITASAGFVFAAPHYPVYRLAKRAGVAEYDAKRLDGSKKNGLSLGDSGKVFSWARVTGELVDALKLFEPFMKSERASKWSWQEDGLGAGFLYQFLQLARDQARGGEWVPPRMAWLFGRHRPRDEKNFAGPWQALKNHVFRTEVDWTSLETAALLALMMMRKGGKV